MLVQTAFEERTDPVKETARNRIFTEIGENCHLFPGSIIGGQCEIGRNVTFSPRSTVKHNTRIGKNQIIKSGSVINKDLEDLIRNQK